MPHRNKPFSFQIDLPVQNQWRNVDLLRTSVQNCFIAVFADLDGCHAIAMVTGELVENAVKYGSWQGPDTSFRLVVHGAPGVVTIQVENPVDPADRAGVEELEKTIAWIASQPSAEAAYRAKLLEIAEAPPSSESGLGLVRCAYEGNSTLRSEVIGGTMLRVTAEMRF